LLRASAAGGFSGMLVPRVIGIQEVHCRFYKGGRGMSASRIFGMVQLAKDIPHCHSKARSIGEESASCQQRSSRFLAPQCGASERQFFGNFGSWRTSTEAGSLVVRARTFGTQVPQNDAGVSRVDG
jgi:hypothetical protein